MRLRIEVKQKDDSNMDKDDKQHYTIIGLPKKLQSYLTLYIVIQQQN